MLPSRYVWTCAYFRHQLCDVAEGLRFLHSRNIVHGDLRGVRNSPKRCSTTLPVTVQSNVLVDGAGRARITDFSQATVVQNPDSMRVVPGDQGNTTQWTAPEILNETGTYSKASDVFSFAMIMIEVRPRRLIICRHLTH